MKFGESPKHGFCRGHSFHVKALARLASMWPRITPELPPSSTQGGGVKAADAKALLCSSRLFRLRRGSQRDPPCAPFLASCLICLGFSEPIEHLPRGRGGDVMAPDKTWPWLLAKPTMHCHGRSCTIGYCIWMSASAYD